MAMIKTLPAVVGGEEASYDMLFKQQIPGGNLFQILDLTDFVYRVEIEWDGEAQLLYSEGLGLTRLQDEPVDDTEAHYRWTITESQTEELLIGSSLVRLIRVSPDGETTIDIVNIKRVR